MPDAKDADKDKIRITIKLGEASVFSEWDKNKIITFKPSNDMVTLKNPYEIKVILEDENKYPMSNEYNFFITVNPKPTIKI